MHISKLMAQRNKLSKMYNRAQKKYLQLDCKFRNDASKPSETGGWCNSERRYYGIDRPVAIELANLFKNASVASFGEGFG